MSQAGVWDTLALLLYSPLLPGGASAKHYTQVVFNEKKKMLRHFREGLYFEPVKCLFRLYVTLPNLFPLSLKAEFSLSSPRLERLTLGTPQPKGWEESLSPSQSRLNQDPCLSPVSPEHGA